MNCDTALSRLDDFIDAELDGREMEMIRRHLEQCASCSREHQVTLSLLEQARALPAEETPTRDLWGGIRTRIGSPAAGSGSTRGRLVLIAAAAALILAVVAGPGLLEPAPSTGVAPVIYQEADQRFAEVREQLLAGLTSGQDRLDPGTARVVWKSLKVIDDSSAEIRKALAADPGNSGLRRMLLSSYRHQAKLLTRVREYPEPM